MNIFQYVKKYGSFSFDEEPFNDIDNVIFSQLSYLPYEGVIGDFDGISITLRDCYFRMQDLYNQGAFQLRYPLYKKVFKLFKELSKTKRYGEILMSNYYKVIDFDRQFGAVTLELPDHSVYVSYEGTDTTISGWKEDACMSYCFPVPAQELALFYLKKVISIYKHKIRVGGHSKGGNLAIYATMELPFYLQKKVITVYSNDGPGFLKEVVQSKKYQRISKKIRKIVPNESVVGMLLYGNEDIIVVKSSGKWLFQHYVFNWQIDGLSYEKGTLSMFSRKVSEKIKRWMEAVEKKERKQCVEDLFDTFAFTEIMDIYDFYSLRKSFSTMREMKHLNENSKRNLWNALKVIV